MIDTNWQTILLAYGPLGILAVFVGVRFLTIWIKGDPVMKLAEACAAHIAVGNELTKQNTDVLRRVTSVLEVANEGRDHMANMLDELRAEHKEQAEAIKMMGSKFDNFSKKLKMN